MLNLMVSKATTGFRGLKQTYPKSISTRFHEYRTLCERVFITFVTDIANY
jgi:hypothetical protein